MIQRFLPALLADNSPWMPGGSGHRSRIPKKILKKRPSRVHKNMPTVLNWMDDELAGTDGYYPNALIAYPRWREIGLNMPTGCHIFGDSGGYSIMTLGIDIDSYDVMRWQQRHAACGPLLDVPPVTKDGKIIFDEALEATVNNVMRTRGIYTANKDRYPFRWWGVVHGWSGKQLLRWYQKIAEQYPFDGEGEGWAVKPRPNITPATAAYVLSFLASVGIRRTHFLMTTSSSVVSTLLALGPLAGIDYLTYDSTTACTSGMNREIMVPTADGLDWYVLAEKFRESGGTDRKARDFVHQVCRCYSCRTLQEDQERDPELVSRDSYLRYRFMFHNILTQVQVFRNIEKEANDPQFLHTVLGNQYSDTMRAFDGKGGPEAPSSTRSLLDL